MPNKRKKRKSNILKFSKKRKNFKKKNLSDLDSKNNMHYLTNDDISFKNMKYKSENTTKDNNRFK